MIRQQQPVLATISTITSRLSGVLASFVAVLLFLLMVGICADVFARNVLGRPIAGVSELAALSVVLIVFLAVPTAIEQKRMARTELFLDGLAAINPNLLRIVETLLQLAGVLACALIAYAIWPSLVRAIERGQYLGMRGVFTFPLWPLQASIILGASLGAVQYLLQAISVFLIAPGKVAR